MSDITKCKGTNCLQKDTCYRFLAPSSMWQSYFTESPIKNGKCENYREVKI
jgi:hypothetical protein